MIRAKEYFTQEQQNIIVAAVKQAESRTHGQIRVFIEDECEGDPLDRAAFIFQHLEIHKTEHRHAVLFYLALYHRKFAILGDAGINAMVAPDFWDDIKFEMLRHFKAHDFTTGLAKGIRMAGHALKTYFPHEKGDDKIMPDEIVFGE